MNTKRHRDGWYPPRAQAALEAETAAKNKANMALRLQRARVAALEAQLAEAVALPAAPREARPMPPAARAALVAAEVEDPLQEATISLATVL